MASLLHAPLLLLTTLTVAVNLSLNPVLGDTLLGGTEESSMQEDGAPEALKHWTMLSASTTKTTMTCI